MSRLASRALVVLASCLLLLALVAGYVKRAVLDSDQFANRATAALRDDSVRGLIAARITDDVILEKEEDLLPARPIIESVTADLVGSSAFTGLFRSAVRDVHRTLFERDRATFTLTVEDVGTVLAAALEQLRPGLARQVEATERVALIRRDLGSAGADLARVADRVRLLAVLSLVLALVAVAGALALSPDRRRTAVELGVGAAAAGVLLVVALGVLRPIAIDSVDGPEARDAAGAVWDAFLGDLRTAGWIMAGCGAVVAAAASSYLKPAPLGAPLGRAWAWVAAEPERPWPRVLRGAGFVAAGVIVLVGRDAVVQLFLTLLGAYLVYEGVAAILRVIHREPAPEAERPARDRRRLVPAVVAGVVIAIAIAAFTGGGGITTAAPARPGCNGHQELCDTADRRAGSAGHPQLHGGPAARLVRGRAGRPDRRPAARRRPWAPDRHALRRQASRRQGPHRDRERVEAAPAPGGRGRCEPPGGGRRAADSRPARGLGAGEARDVPVPHVLRDRRHAAGSRARRPPRLPRGQSRRVRDGHQRGLREARGLHEGGRGRRARRPRLPRARERRVADATRGDRPRLAGAVPGGERGGRAALVPPRVQEHRRGHALHVTSARQLTDPEASPRPASPTAAPRARRCSS